mmetsp:Transcript_11215/g.27570  ORF Transcript_11215/g.27570 Transcript_11215/m.27570 type:complete len:206 (-) Transcript_11215:974-1591(-)
MPSNFSFSSVNLFFSNCNLAFSLFNASCCACNVAFSVVSVSFSSVMVPIVDSSSARDSNSVKTSPSQLSSTAFSRSYDHLGERSRSQYGAPRGKTLSTCLESGSSFASSAPLSMAWMTVLRTLISSRGGAPVLSMRSAFWMGSECATAMVSERVGSFVISSMSVSERTPAPHTRSRSPERRASLTSRSVAYRTTSRVSIWGAPSQ